MNLRPQILAAALFLFPSLSPTRAATPPGTTITHLPASSRQYIGSPSLAVLPDGSYVASHDFFGPSSGNNRTAIFLSADRGLTWSPQSEITGQWWSTLFSLHDSLYLLGTDKEWGQVVIRRSTDHGKTWSTPTSPSTGLLLASAHYHCAPGAVLIQDNRVYRAIEAVPTINVRARFQPFLLSAPADSDLLNAANWTRSPAATPGDHWLDGDFNGWLEGNVLPTPDHHLANLLRVNRGPAGETAALIHLADHTLSPTFDSAKDFIPFPGGNTKFTVRRDPADGTYWSLTNPVPSNPDHLDAGHIRNTLALISSPDLLHWTLRATILFHPDRSKHAFQYVDWLFDHDDLIAVSRTAYDDPAGGAHSYHDANYLTFHRISNFRSLPPTTP